MASISFSWQTPSTHRSLGTHSTQMQSLFITQDLSLKKQPSPIWILSNSRFATLDTFTHAQTSNLQTLTLLERLVRNCHALQWLTLHHCKRHTAVATILPHLQRLQSLAICRSFSPPLLTADRQRRIAKRLLVERDILQSGKRVELESFHLIQAAAAKNNNRESGHD